jgi:uncharacterized membrane protein required for colicin V production
MTEPWNVADLAMLAVLLLSMAVGAWRGLAFELMSLLGWFAAYLAAQWFGVAVAPHVPIGSPGSPLNHAAAFALIFIATLIAWGLLARLMKMLIHATPLSGIDRLLGAAFGGSGVHLAVTDGCLFAAMRVTRADNGAGCAASFARRFS